ncbi:MAG: type II toxin-antitoxin system mRNA interferase toxin, RelE/StbE family [Candidatus Gracilibacteria bacterium]
MKIHLIRYSPHFKKAFKRLPQQVQRRAIEREILFRQNAFDPRLDTHKLKGVFNEYWAFSINYKHRILFRFEQQGEVGFVDVGNHSIYR